MTSAGSTPIAIDYPDASDLHVRISVGACRLRLRPGPGPRWIDGAYHDPSGALPCRITQDGGVVRISQGTNVTGLTGLVSGAPRFALDMGTERPFALTLEAGAAETDLDLGGLPLSRVAIRLGAASSQIDFSRPNPRPMTQFSLNAGAGSVDIKRLSHSNGAEVVVEGGAASLNIDFDGRLARDMTGRVSAGIASVAIDAPATTAAKITTGTVLGSVTLGDGYTKQLGAFWTPAALTGGTPILTLHVSVTLGSLTLSMDHSG